MDMSQSIFIDQIQPEILATRTALSHLQEKWPDGVALSFERKGIYYYCLPYMFVSAFPSLQLTELRPLNLATCLFASSFFLYDKLMDCNPSPYLSAMTGLQVQAMQFEAYQQLHQIFAPKQVFWSRFQTYVVEYAEACLLEQQFRSGHTKSQVASHKSQVRHPMAFKHSS